MNLLEDEITDKGFLIGLIPQRNPFVMVDKLIYYSEKKIIAGLTITPENILTEQDYFSAPGLIENMAQTIALHTGYKYHLAKKPTPTGYIGAIKTAQIFETPKVTQEITTTVEIVHDIMNVTLVEANVTCNGKIIASSEMKTVLAE